MKKTALPPQNGSPLYQQVKNVLLEQIQSGQYAVGTVLPTEHGLAEKFGVSRATIRNALRGLTDDGLIKSKPRVGAEVVRARKYVETPRLQGLTDHLRRKGIATRARTLIADFITPSPAVRAKLRLREDERVLHLERLREIAVSPFALINSYVPESFGLTPDEDFSGPLYELIERTHNLHIIYGETTIGARLPTEKEADLLQISTGTPVVSTRRTTFTEHNRPIEFVESTLRSDLYEYTVTLNR